MSIEFEFDTRPVYAYVRGTGTFINNQLFESWEQLFEYAETEGRKGLLLDLLQLDGAPPSTVDRYEHGVEVARVQRKHLLKIVLAVVGNEPIVDPARFAELVGTNRYARARVFTDFNQAETWLEDEITLTRRNNVRRQR